MFTEIRTTYEEMLNICFNVNTTYLACFIDEQFLDFYK